MKFETEVIVIGAAYFGYFVAGAVALALLGAYPADDPVLEYAYQVVFVTSGLHFGLMLYGFTQHGYVVHPVKPKWLFLYGDYIMAAALGGTIAAYVLDHDNRTPPTVGNATVLGTQLLCALKTYRLLTDVWAGRRSAEMGALIVPPKA